MLWLLALVPMLAGIAIAVARVRRRMALAVLGCGALALTFALALLAAHGEWTGEWVWSAALRLHAQFSPLSAIVALLVPFIALPVVAYAAMHEDEAGLSRLVALLLFFVGAMELLVVAADLLTLLVGWELVGACSWALIGHAWRDRSNPASGGYAFLMTRCGDLGLFIAALAAFAATGSFAYADLPRLDGPPLHLLVAGVLVAAAAKSGQLPFSPWLFRAMAGPTSVSALLHAATMVAAGAFLLARLQPTLARVEWFAPVAIGIGLATALAGGLVALLQGHAKKLLAASTSAQFGLMFVAVGAGWPSIAIAHLVAHACFKALLFLAAGIAGQQAGGYALARMRLGRALPFIAATSGVGALALAGVPPLGAAWTKEQIVAAAAEGGGWAVVAGVVLAGALSAVYATRLQWLAFGRSEDAHAERPGPLVEAALAWLALATLSLSLLWLPAVRSAFGVELPDSNAAQTTASLLGVAIGLFVGRYLVLRRPDLGQAPQAAAVADWLGLPAFIDRFVAVPLRTLAHALSDIDDRVIDAASRVLARLVRGARRRIASADVGIVDRAVAATAALAQRCATVFARSGEFALDGLPEGAARLAGLGGEDLRRLQSGLSHHYFAQIAVAAALLAALLSFAS